MPVSPPRRLPHGPDPPPTSPYCFSIPYISGPIQNDRRLGRDLRNGRTGTAVPSTSPSAHGAPRRPEAGPSSATVPRAPAGSPSRSTGPAPGRTGNCAAARHPLRAPMSSTRVPGLDPGTSRRYASSAGPPSTVRRHGKPQNDQCRLTTLTADIAAGRSPSVARRTTPRRSPSQRPVPRHPLSERDPGTPRSPRSARAPTPPQARPGGPRRPNLRLQARPPTCRGAGWRLHMRDRLGG